MPRYPFPEVIDSSLMNDFRSCPYRCNLAYIQHWKPRSTSVHLHAGASYATGIETARKAFFRDGKSEEDAIALGLKACFEAYGNFECPSDSAKSLERTVGALEFYFSRYPMSSDYAVPITLPSGAIGVEFSFVEPIDVLHPETGAPLLYAGRFDSLCEFAGGIFGEDDKTTSSLGASWAKQWDLRSQFTSYCWGAGNAGIHLKGFLVRGISILKTKYDTMECITYRPQWQIDRWYVQLLRDVKRMIAMWEDGYFDMSLGDACNEYGGCQFRTVCQVEQPDRWLATDFVRRRWDPVTRTETLLED